MKQAYLTPFLLLLHPVLHRRNSYACIQDGYHRIVALFPQRTNRQLPDFWK
jgi:hypothetical protein